MSRVEYMEMGNSIAKFVLSGQVFTLDLKSDRVLLLKCFNIIFVENNKHAFKNAIEIGLKEQD